jgi:hypothetical protein
MCSTSLGFLVCKIRTLIDFIGLLWNLNEMRNSRKELNTWPSPLGAQRATNTVEFQKLQSLWGEETHFESRKLPCTYFKVLMT